MTVQRRTVEDMAERFDDRIEELENANGALEDSLSDARRERDEALKEQAELENRVLELERALESVRDAVKGL